MKKLYRINIIIFVLVTFALVFSLTAFNVSENTVQSLPQFKDLGHVKKAAELVNSRKQYSIFNDVNLFKKSNKVNSDALNSFAAGVSLLNIDKSSLSSINSSKPNEINFIIPKDEESIELELVRINFLPENFRIKAMGENGSVSYTKFDEGLYYRGILKGDNTSVVTVSIFNDNVMGIISTNDGNYILGPVKDIDNRPTDEYIFYNDRDVINKPDFQCAADDYSGLFSKVERGNLNKSSSRTTSPVRVYFVCDHQMYLDNGSNVNLVGQFVTGAFAHVITLYANEQIPVVLSSEIFVYTSPDPYVGFSGSYDILNEFGSRTQDDFDGDLAHLLSTGHGQQLGGIAWINVLCQSYIYFPPPDDAHYGRFAFSNIENNYSPFPVYSWTVMVITHEMGHNFASKHTHACVWPTVSGQIDSCVNINGESCVGTTQQNNNGTIMSYCHLNGGINFTRGFGSLPGDTVRLGYELAACLDSAVNSSEAPVTFNLLQNYPNPFNPSTNITFALPEDGYVTLRVYDLLGREVTRLIDNNYYPIGIFTSRLDASDLSLASGVYLYKLDVNKSGRLLYSQIKKMVLVK
ncbi:MAG: M12 family metallo-peptidase [Chlorobi bacterium]|nr:M12 family metallo-peptidase [Chlorobiota bacterium]MCI0714717.1 M12 family metallo-peptidase [Chlorobiota bacterium]